MLRCWFDWANRARGLGRRQRRAVASSNSDLIAQAIGGDRDALSALLKSHTPMLRSRLAGRVPPRWRPVLTVDDLLQETYTDAFLGIRDFVAVSEASFRAWLCTTAFRNLVNALKMLEAEKRGGGRRPVLGGGGDSSHVDVFELLGGTCSTPSRQVARAEAREALRQALAKLPDHYRRVIELYDLHGCRIEEVACELKRSPGAVHLMRLRAHRRLEALMGRASKFLTTV